MPRSSCWADGCRLRLRGLSVLGGHGRSPTPGCPFPKCGRSAPASCPNRARVHMRVGEAVEEPGGDVAEELPEIRGVGCPADAAGEQRVAGEQVVAAVGGHDVHSHPAGVCPRRAMIPTSAPPAAGSPTIRCRRRPARRRWRRRAPAHPRPPPACGHRSRRRRGERPPVVAVAVGGENPCQRPVSQQRGRCRARRRHRPAAASHPGHAAGRRCCRWAHRQLGQGDGAQVDRLRRGARRRAARVRHGCGLVAPARVGRGSCPVGAAHGLGACWIA